MTGTSGASSSQSHEAADRAREIVDGLGDGFLSLDADWRITDCNRVSALLMDVNREDLLGRQLWEVSGTSMDSPFGVLAQRVAATRTAEEAEIDYRGRVLSVQVFPLGGGIGAVSRDITDVRAAERRLAQSEALYRELADGTPAAAWLSRADGTLQFVNQAMADALGRPREALLDEGWVEALDPDDRPSMLEARLQARAAHSPYHYEGRFRRPDGALRIIELYGRPRFDGSGAFEGHVGMATDVTEVRFAERRQKLLIDELNHRVKNTLATVQSLVRLTLREGGVASPVASRVTERLQALSAAHNVLNREGWDGADLAEIVQTAVKPYADERITLAGPAARIAPNAAVTLSMALHELAADALDHGALSTPAGQIRLSWTRSDAFIALEWRESGGPAVTAPEPASFGARLLGPGLAGEWGAAAELTYAPEGLVCRLRPPAQSDAGPPP